MGAYLNKPVTDKESEDMENEVLVCGASTMQGWRDGQEVIDFIIDRCGGGVRRPVATRVACTLVPPDTRSGGARILE